MDRSILDQPRTQRSLQLVELPWHTMNIFVVVSAAAETGVVMLIYLDQALQELKAEVATEGRPFTREDLHIAIIRGAVDRVRPKIMTFTAIMAGLLPILWNHGTG